MRILITGASGLLGKNLIRSSLAAGHEVVALVRNPADLVMLPMENVFSWQELESAPAKVFGGVEAVVHLAGENIADRRWSHKRKQALRNSRILTTRTLVSALKSLPAEQRPATLISGSAIGYYGYEREEILTEGAAPGKDFLAQLCREWEQEAQPAEALGIRVVYARTGIVLSREGGALPQMPPIQVSHGRNVLSWIHVEDWVRAIHFVLRERKVQGPVNFVAPGPVQNRDFVRELAKVFGIPTFGFVPKLLLQVILGELAQAILSSQRVAPTVLQDCGFHFEFPDLASALKRELGGRSVLDQFFIRDQFVARAPAEVFPFFTKAENLETLTPPWLNFRIIRKSTPEIQQGTLIDYRLKIHGVPVGWRTLISQWHPGKNFVDEQLRGPYSKWHHLHTFTSVTGGVLLGDEVTYRVPGWLPGKLLLSRWIRGDITQIFAYRQKRILELEATSHLR
jgi:uncharacterized protein (TIGR01777 family)